MRRFARHLFTLFLGLSLLLCAGTVTLWTASLGKPLVLREHSQQPDRAWRVDLHAGLLRWTRQRVVTPHSAPGSVTDVRTPDTVIVLDSSGALLARSSDPAVRDAGPLWFHESDGDYTAYVGNSVSPVVVRASAVRAPLWIVAVIFAVPAVLQWLVGPLARRWRWARSGHCPKCGYDLRATPGRCPECGTAAAAAPAADWEAPAAPPG